MSIESESVIAMQISLARISRTALAAVVAVRKHYSISRTALAPVVVVQKPGLTPTG